MPTRDDMRTAMRDDSGFSILESMMAITVVTIVMTALTVLYANTMSSVSAARYAQTSTRMATHAVDRAAALGGADAQANRGQSAVAAQFAAAPEAVKPWLADMDMVWDSLAPTDAGAEANLPTTSVTETLGTTTFTTNYYVGSCERGRGAITADSTCLPRAAAAAAFTLGTTSYIRVVVAIQWTDKTCAADGCIRISAVLLNSNELDPVFNLNYAPPPPPKITNCTDQTSAVGDIFEAKNPDGELQDSENVEIPDEPQDPNDSGDSGDPAANDTFRLTVVANSEDETGVCELSDGVPPFTWSATGLPEGLELRADGQFETSGSDGITSEADPNPVIYQLTVHDAFQRTATIEDLKWTVVPTLLVGEVGDQFGAVGLEISGPTLSATGGQTDGGSYTWEVTGLPDGIEFDDDINGFAGFIGTPTTDGTFVVTVSVSDESDVRTNTFGFTWQIYKALAVEDPGPQTSEADEEIDAVALDASLGSGEYTVTDESASLPDGLKIVGDLESGYGIVGSPTFEGTWDVVLVFIDTVTTEQLDLAFEWTVLEADANPPIGDDTGGDVP